MFRTVLISDIGTENIKSGLRGSAATEKNCIALQSGQELHIAAYGNEAAAFRSGRIIHPMHEGAAASTNMLALLMKHLAQKYTGRKSTSYIELHTALPRVTAGIKRRSFIQALKLAGFKEFEIYDSLLMGAIGAGVDIRSHTAEMVVDIGSETTGAAIFCNGGILFENTAIAGGKAAECSLKNYFLENHSLLIGARTAETIKINLDKDVFVVDGRSCATGFPERVSVSGEMLREAALHGLRNVFSCIEDTIKSVQPEAAADLLDNGITFIGGGAGQYGLAEEAEKRFGLPVRIAENAVTAAVDGMKECIFGNKKMYREIISENAEFASGE